MQKNKTLYVAYGSNMNVEQMQHRCPTAKVVTSMFLEGYRLRFMGGHYSAVATIEPSDDDLVPITVWEIYPEDERNLDIYEGYPHLYRKETLKLKLGKKDILCDGLHHQRRKDALRPAVESIFRNYP